MTDHSVSQTPTDLPEDEASASVAVPQPHESYANMLRRNLQTGSNRGSAPRVCRPLPTRGGQRIRPDSRRYSSHQNRKADSSVRSHRPLRMSEKNVDRTPKRQRCRSSQQHHKQLEGSQRNNLQQPLQSVKGHQQSSQQQMTAHCIKQPISTETTNDASPQPGTDVQHDLGSGANSESQQSSYSVLHKASYRDGRSPRNPSSSRARSFSQRYPSRSLPQAPQCDTAVSHEYREKYKKLLEYEQEEHRRILAEW